MGDAPWHQCASLRRREKRHAEQVGVVTRAAPTGRGSAAAAASDENTDLCVVQQNSSRRRLSSPQAAAYRAQQVKGDAQQAAQPRDPAQPGRATAHLLRESAPSPPRRGPAHCSRQAAAGEQTAVTKPPRDSVAQTSAPDAQAAPLDAATSRQVQAVEALDQAAERVHDALGAYEDAERAHTKALTELITLRLEQSDLPVTTGQAVPREAVQELVRAAAGLNDWAECHSFGLPGASLPLPAGLAGRLRQLRAALEPVCRFLSFGDVYDWEDSYPEALAQQDSFLEQ